MKTPQLQAPAGACDCHIHVYDLARYPLGGGGPSGPPQTVWSDYLEVRKALDLSRAVIVQATGYGYDNRGALDALAESRGTARMIATLPLDTPDARLRELHNLGVRGLRFMMVPNGGGIATWDMLVPMAHRIAELGWVINLQLDGRDLPQYESLLQDLPCRLSIDHNGKFLAPVQTSHPSFLCLLRLLDNGRTWVKLSAPYETSRIGPPGYDDVSMLAHTLADTHPERCLWASNYPHPGRTQPPEHADMLDMLLQWAPETARQRRILVENPAELYGF